MSKTRNNLEPIAVTGIGCRFPGGICDPASFWDVLRAGRNVITETPPGRWDLDSFYHPNPEKPGRMATRFGGYLENIDEFDAAFFGFSPREAAFLDPQQRLLLETVWEAFEDGGHPPEGMAGTRTCVFVGEFALDYKLLLLSPLQRELIGAHTCTGSFATMIANRISHWFDLRGPSVTLDTACSSSLVAVHLACQSLWSGESDYAVVGGGERHVHAGMDPGRLQGRVPLAGRPVPGLQRKRRRLRAQRGLRRGAAQASRRGARAR